MDSRDLFEIIDKFEASDLNRLSVSDRDFSLDLERGGQTSACCTPSAITNGNQVTNSAQLASSQATGNPLQTSSQALAATQQPTVDLGNNAAEVPASNAVQVKSPLVGTYYEAPDPNSEAFVKMGQIVEKGETLCIIESMKMLNELKSPTKGKITSIYGCNGEMTEFNQLLFEVEPC